ncbi:MAG: TetR/AcrR family transcriptional regulator [Kiritimatiellae bacterium]|jgi:AcrR family transcriptional regulator|nr:TetR/AcrR family transcriptional regulator [Kiritimatiellia bacterium]
MAKPVNHKERKREICATSIRLFAQRGYQDVNFGTIAKECGISRTLVYTYFKDKRTIFNQAIIELTTAAADKYRELARSEMSADAKLRELCVTVFALLFDNRDFLCVIVDRLCAYRMTGKLPVENIMRHTLGFKRIVHSMIVEACHRGEYDSSLDPNKATALVYSQFEAAILQLAVSGGAGLASMIGQMNLLLSSFR